MGPSRSAGVWHAEGSCGAQYLSRAPALGVNSLTHHGGLHHRRSVSPVWQYVGKGHSSALWPRRETVVRPHGGGVGGGPKGYGGGSHQRPGTREGKGPTCDDVLNGTILPRKQAGAPWLGAAQLCNQLLLLPLVPLRWGLGLGI